MLPNPYIILGTAGAWLASILLVGWLTYTRGHDDMRNAYTEASLAQAQKDLADHKKNDKIADAAGKKFEDEKTKIVTQIQYRDRTRDVFIPPDSDPFLPIWAVRMWNDLASIEPPSDPYPGQSPDAPSRTRLSGIRPVLRAWVVKYETCRKQIDDIRELKPVLPLPPGDKPDFLDHINPFQ
jgi:hypothetical protein